MRPAHATGPHGPADYWMLVASLPPLPPLQPLLRGAAAAPQPRIGAQRLQARLGLLPPSDAHVLAAVRELLAWQAAAGPQADAAWLGRGLALACGHAAVVAAAAATTRGAVATLLRPLLADRLLLAALVLRDQQQRGVGTPDAAAGPARGTGPRTSADAPASGAGPMSLRPLLAAATPLLGAGLGQALLRRWAEPAFGLASALPWLAQAQAHLAGGRQVELQALMDMRLWRACEALAAQRRFGFAAVLGWCLRWDLAERHAAANPDRARALLAELIEAERPELPAAAAAAQAPVSASAVGHAGLAQASVEPVALEQEAR